MKNQEKISSININPNNEWIPHRVRNDEALVQNDYEQFKNNSFTFIRLFLAICVIISHSLALYFDNSSEPRLPLNGYYITLGNFAVYAFFAISGFVITHSYITRPNWKLFLTNRIRRIFPGLIVCLFLTIVFFAPLLTKNPQIYFQNEISNATSYLLLNSTGFDFQTNIGNTLKELRIEHEEINPVLWTIRYEIIAYIVVALIGFFGILKKQIVGILFIVSNFLYWITLEIPQLHIWLNTYFLFAEMFVFLSYFFAGSLIYFFRERIINQGWRTNLLLGLSVFILLNSIISNQLSIFGPFSISLITIILGYKLPFQKIPKWLPDISYGVYIYGWLTQLLIIRYLRDYLDYPQYISLVIILTTSLGYGSYWLVERRFLKL